MKNGIKYIALLGVSLFLCSCEGLLDRFPLDKLSPETFLSSEAEMQTYTNALYTMFPSGFFLGKQNDTWVCRDLDDEIRGARTPNSGDGGWSWTALRRINTFMEYAGNCKDEAIRNQYTGLVRFFRAYFYFEKVKQFGDVPWYDHTLGSDDPDLYKARDSRELVMQKMVEDINFAIDNLPKEHSDYRVTKWTALALKSRFCLFEGTFRKYHAGDVTLATLPSDAKPYTWYLEQAADAADKFIASSGYSIYNKEGADASYIGLFTKYNVSEGTNREVILARDYNVEYGVTHSANADYTSTTMGKRGLTKKMVASYLMSDGSRFTDSATNPGWETMEFADETQNRDPRLAQTIRTPGYCRLGTTTRLAPNLKHSVTGYAPIKYFMGPSDDVSGQSYCDIILFRAAEVYLNYAEAKAELGTVTQADIDRTIKPLRDRVGMPNLNMTTANADPDPFLTNAAWGGYSNPVLLADANKGLILEIRRERTIELFGEGFRYYDVIRWAEGHVFEVPLYGMYFHGADSYDLDGDGVNDITLYTGDAAPVGHAPSTFKIGSEIKLSEGTSGYVDFHQDSRPGWTWNDGKDYYYPIPIKDRTLTGGVLTQNPGWSDSLSL
ncbi:MAG: RagB/SusD family nutrient uptake outer membrane protein [Bacteroidales bacterium]|nr:RagB/SusD family nutrient uptake outer membrane protein [Bacteroidales bacterium]